jgi:hypothetical protein
MSILCTTETEQILKTLAVDWDCLLVNIYNRVGVEYKFCLPNRYASRQEMRAKQDALSQFSQRQILVGTISGFVNRRYYSPMVSIQIFTTVGL